MITNRQTYILFRYIDDPELEASALTASAVIEAHGKAWKVRVKENSIGGARVYQIISFEKTKHGGENIVFTMFESRDCPDVATFLYLFKFSKTFTP